MKMTLNLMLSVNDSPLWSQRMEVNEKLNHPFTRDEMLEAIMAAEDHLMGLAKKKKKKVEVESPGGTD